MCGTDNIEIRFDHRMQEPYEIEGLTGVCVEESRRCSIATVNVNGRYVGEGIAICHPSDNFCRTIGRKRALADAMYALTKDARTAAWSAYKERCKI